MCEALQKKAKSAVEGCGFNQAPLYTFGLVTLKIFLDLM